jgi:hypothetical protein
MEREQTTEGDAQNRLMSLKIAIQQARGIDDVLPILDAVAREIRRAMPAKRLKTTEIQMIASCLTDSQLLLNELVHSIPRPSLGTGTGLRRIDLSEQCRELDCLIKEVRRDLDQVLRGY